MLSVLFESIPLSASAEVTRCALLYRANRSWDRLAEVVEDWPEKASKSK